jgi:hypothetical protein
MSWRRGSLVVAGEVVARPAPGGQCPPYNDRYRRTAFGGQLFGDPSAPGSHRCRGRNRDRDRFRLGIVVGPHVRCSQLLVAKSHLLSFDSDSDTDTDPDYNPYRDRTRVCPVLKKCPNPRGRFANRSLRPPANRPTNASACNCPEAGGESARRKGFAFCHQRPIINCK